MSDGVRKVSGFGCPVSAGCLMLDAWYFSLNVSSLDPFHTRFERVPLQERPFRSSSNFGFSLVRQELERSRQISLAALRDTVRHRVFCRRLCVSQSARFRPNAIFVAAGLV